MSEADKPRTHSETCPCRAREEVKKPMAKPGKGHVDVSGGKSTSGSKSTGKSGVGHTDVSSGKLQGGSKQLGRSGKGHTPLK